MKLTADSWLLHLSAVLLEFALGQACMQSVQEFFLVHYMPETKFKYNLNYFVELVFFQVYLLWLENLKSQPTNKTLASE